MISEADDRNQNHSRHHGKNNSKDQNMKQTLGLLSAIALLGLGAGTARAAITWTDGTAGNSDWSDAGNWSGALSDLTRVFNDTALGTSNMNVSPSLAITKLTYANTANTHTLALNGNTLNISGGIDAGYETQTSTAIIQNGSMVLAGSVRIGFCDNVGAAQNTAGSVTLNNVAVTTGNIADVFVGYSFHSTGTLLDSASGTWDMSGSHNGVFNNQGGGEFEVGGSR